MISRIGTENSTPETGCKALGLPILLTSQQATPIDFAALLSVKSSKKSSATKKVFQVTDFTKVMNNASNPVASSKTLTPRINNQLNPISESIEFAKLEAAISKKLLVTTEKSAASLEVSDPLGLLSKRPGLVTVTQPVQSQPKLADGNPLNPELNGIKPSLTIAVPKSELNHDSNQTPSESDSKRESQKKSATTVVSSGNKFTEPKPVEMSDSQTALSIANLTKNSSKSSVGKAESVRSSMPTPEPVKLPELMHRLGAELKQRWHNGDRILEMMVATPMLGQLRMELTEEDGKMSAKFITDSPIIRDQLMKDRDQLASLIPAVDGKTADISVTLDPSAGRSSQQHQTTSQHSSEHASKSPMARFLTPTDVVAPRRSYSPNATREWIG